MNKKLFILVLVSLWNIGAVMTAANVFTAEVNGNVMTFQIIDGDKKTVQLGNGKETAISTEISGVLSIPVTVKADEITYSVISIADSAFYSCNKLTSIEIPSSIKSSGKDAFLGCSGLQKVIASDLTAWCAIAFSNKPSNPLYYAKHLYSDEDTEITDLVVPDGIANIKPYSFIKGSFKTVTVPSSVAEIQTHSFYKCTSLTSLSIAEGVNKVRTNAFYGCTALASVTLPEGMTRIGTSSFYQCTALEKIELPASISEIGNTAFKLCSNLKQVTSNIQSPKAFGTESFASISADCKTFVPVGTLAAYSNAGWTKDVFGGGVFEKGEVEADGITFTIIDDKTAQIGGGTKAAISAETSGDFVIPTTFTRNGILYQVISLAESAFNGCNKLTSVAIPSSIKSSGNNAFYGCSGLQKVIVSDLTAWCAIAFSNKPSNPLYYAKHLYSDEESEITDLVIPEGIAKINAYAFIKGSFKTVTIPGSVAEINSYSFYKCTSLTSVNMAKGVGKTHTNAFYGCTALTSVTLPDGMTRIGTSSFYQCTALEKIELPASISEIGNTAFKLCSNLKQVTSNNLSPKAFGTESFASISADCKLYIPVGTLPKYNSVGWTKDVFAGGIVEVGDVEVNYNIENGVTADFIKDVAYPNDDYSYTKITDYNTQKTSYRKDLPQPVRIEAPITNNGKALVLETYNNGVLVRSDNYLVGQRSIEIWNLIPQTRYTYKLYLIADNDTRSEVSQGSFKTEGQVRMINIDGMCNFRDIGGWKLSGGQYMRYDKIFRSAELDVTDDNDKYRNITTAGIYELMDVLNIGVEIDFGDFDGSPVSDRVDFSRGSEYQITPCAGGVKSKGAQYKNCFVKTVEGLRKGKKILFHCSAGADRTGTFAFLLEGLLGVSESDLAKEYELTSLKYDKRYRNVTKSTYENMAYLDYKGLIDYVKSTFSGSTINEKIENMALSFGISPEDIADFRDLMTEPNVLSTPDLSILKENTAKWSVSMANKNEITAFQFDVEVPQGVTVTGVQLGNRKSSSHTVDFSKQADGCYRVIGTSLQSAPFSGNEGELVSLILSTDGTVKKGDYSIVLKDIVLTSPSKVKYYPADANALLTVLDCLQGDADGDGIIDVADVVAMVNYILGNPTSDFVSLAADLNGDGEIDVFDVMMAINLVLNQKNIAKSKARAMEGGNALEPMYMTIDNDAIKLDIDNADKYTAFQFDVEVADGSELIEVKLNASEGTHLLSYEKREGNWYRVMAVSLDNSPLRADQGLISLLLSDNKKLTMIDNIKFVTPQNESVYFAISQNGSTTGIQAFGMEKNEAIYNLSGRRFSSRSNLPKGVYIINNIKVVIK